MAAKMIVEKFLPFIFFSSGTAWTKLVGVLTSGNTPFPALPARRVEHLIVEIYVATKKATEIFVDRRHLGTKHGGGDKEGAASHLSPQARFVDTQRCLGANISPFTASSWTANSSFGRTTIVGGTEESKDDSRKENDQLGQAVQGEIMRYQALYMDTSEMDCKTVVSWWGQAGKIKFPYLVPVAQQVFGNKATAAQVERDFSACGNLLVPNRGRIDSYWVEMVMFLKANYEHVPLYGDIHMIPSNNIRACIPARFSGRDTDLLAAEAAIDVLNSTEIPADGMTMN